MYTGTGPRESERSVPWCLDLMLIALERGGDRVVADTRYLHRPLGNKVPMRTLLSSCSLTTRRTSHLVACVRSRSIAFGRAWPG